MGFWCGQAAFSIARLNTRCRSQEACRSAHKSSVTTSEEGGGEVVLLLSYSYIWRIGEPKVLSKKVCRGEEKAREVVRTLSIMNFCILVP